MKKLTDLSSQQPHLIYAFHFWLGENFTRTFLTFPASVVTNPTLRSFINPETNTLTLNITDGAVKDLVIDKDFISFGARFSGTHVDVKMPTSALLYISSPDIEGHIVAAFELEGVNISQERVDDGPVDDREMVAINKRVLDRDMAEDTVVAALGLEAAKGNVFSFPGKKP